MVVRTEFYYGAKRYSEKVSVAPADENLGVDNSCGMMQTFAISPMNDVQCKSILGLCVRVTDARSFSDFKNNVCVAYPYSNKITGKIPLSSEFTVFMLTGSEIIFDELLSPEYFALTICTSAGPGGRCFPECAWQVAPRNDENAELEAASRSQSSRRLRRASLAGKPLIVLAMERVTHSKEAP